MSKEFSGPNAPVLPVECFREEVGGRAEPAPTRIFCSCGAGNCFVDLPLWTLFLLREVVWYSWIVLHFHSRWFQGDENLKILEGINSDFIVNTQMQFSVYSLVDTVKSLTVKMCVTSHLFPCLILHYLLGWQHLCCSNGRGQTLQIMKHQRKRWLELIKKINKKSTGKDQFQLN